MRVFLLLPQYCLGRGLLDMATNQIKYVYHLINCFSQLKNCDSPWSNKPKLNDSARPCFVSQPSHRGWKYFYYHGFLHIKTKKVSLICISNNFSFFRSDLMAMLGNPQFKSPLSWDLVGRNLLCLAIMGFLLFVIILAAEYRCCKGRCSCKKRWDCYKLSLRILDLYLEAWI